MTYTTCPGLMQYLTGQQCVLMQQECEQKGRQLSTAIKRMAVLNDKFKQVEGQLEEEKQQTTLLHQQARQALAVKSMHSLACYHPQ